jgi:hypothetical protein
MPPLHFAYLFWRWGFANYLSGCPQTAILLISASQVARITDVSHQCPAILLFCLWVRDLSSESLSHCSGGAFKMCCYLFPLIKKTLVFCCFKSK